VIFFLSQVHELYVSTGKKEYSRTGRNARVTNIVDHFDPYSVVPAAFGKVVRRSGELIRPAGDLGILATYWHEFGDQSGYSVYIDDFKGTTLLKTQTGEKTIGGMIRHATWKGTLLMLPPPDLSAAIRARVDALKKQQKRKSPTDSSAQRRSEVLTKKAENSVAKQFISALFALDKAARNATAVTPPPAWSQQKIFELRSEQEVRPRIRKNIAAVQKLQDERMVLDQELLQTQQLKDLLFEKGKPLETAILGALKILGFQAENLQEADSEFDAVILDPTGARLIGEAEGKDDKAINVDKLDQLDRNIREDFSRQAEASPAYAKGVLFGNPYRLSAPEERKEFFTAKCLLASKRSHISLVRTTDLFEMAKHLDETPNEQFAATCRKVILECDGEVVFPQIPTNPVQVDSEG